MSDKEPRLRTPRELLNKNGTFGVIVNPDGHSLHQILSVHKSTVWIGRSAKSIQQLHEEGYKIIIDGEERSFMWEGE